MSAFCQVSKIMAQMEYGGGLGEIMFLGLATAIGVKEVAMGPEVGIPNEMGTVQVLANGIDTLYEDFQAFKLHVTGQDQLLETIEKASESRVSAQIKPRIEIDAVQAILMQRDASRARVGRPTRLALSLASAF